MDLIEALELANDKILLAFLEEWEREAYVLAKVKEIRKAYDDWFDLTHELIMNPCTEFIGWRYLHSGKPQ